MKNQALVDIIRKRPRYLREGRIEIVFEAGRVVHISIHEEREDRELLDIIEREFAALKQKRFYGSVKLPIKEERVKHPKIETSLE